MLFVIVSRSWPYKKPMLFLEYFSLANLSFVLSHNAVGYFFLEVTWAPASAFLEFFPSQHVFEIGK